MRHDIMKNSDNFDQINSFFLKTQIPAPKQVILTQLIEKIIPPATKEIFNKEHASIALKALLEVAVATGNEQLKHAVTQHAADMQIDLGDAAQNDVADFFSKQKITP
jgi:hypothetical protein